MKFSVLAALALTGLLLTFPVKSGHGGKIFTNEDIEKYKTGPDDADSSEKRDADQGDETYVYTPDAHDSEEKLGRYVVPYEGSSRRIIIPVTFNGRVTAPMLLDTGAPGMHISVRLAEELGIIESKESELWVMIGGIGGNTPAILTIIDSIQVAGAENRFIPTFVSRSIAPNFEGLIGMDFMANYSVRINTRNRTVIFEERSGEANMPAGHDESWWRTTFYQFKSIRDAWGEYRQKLARYGTYTDNQKQIELFTTKQYERADELYNRLSVFASENSVPLQWR